MEQGFSCVLLARPYLLRQVALSGPAAPTRLGAERTMPRALHTERSSIAGGSDIFGM